MICCRDTNVESDGKGNGMKNSIKLKGRLKKYLQTSIYLGILLILVTLGIFVIDYRAGLILACFDIFIMQWCYPCFCIISRSL